MTKSSAQNKLLTFIQDGMTVGMSGFTRAGEAKAVPLALVEQAQTNPFKNYFNYRCKS